MIEALFFLRFKTQLRKTRPQILSRLEDAFTSAAAAAGGEIWDTHHVLSASFGEKRIGFFIDILLFIENLKKSIEDAGRELSGHALVIGENIPLEGRERLCLDLSSETVSRFSGIWCGESLRQILEPYCSFENSGGKYGELKDFSKNAGPRPQFPAREKIVQTLLQKVEKGTLLAGPPYIGKLDGVYHFCKNLPGDIPPLVIRFGGGNPACFAGAMTDEIRFFLAREPGVKPEVLEELDALAEYLFRERLRSEFFPALLDAARRFLELLLVSWAAAARGAAPELPGAPLILENIPVPGEITASLFREVYRKLEGRKYAFLLYGTCSVPDDSVETAFPGRDFTEWRNFFPKIIRFSSDDFPAREKFDIPLSIWETSYVFALLGRFFPSRLFPELFKDEGLNPSAPEEAMEMLAALGVIDIPGDPEPRIPDFFERAEKRLDGASGPWFSGKDRIRQMVRSRLLARVDSGSISPCFAFLGILDNLGGRAWDALILRVIREDIFSGAYRTIGEFAEKGSFKDLADGRGSSALLWIYKTLKALVWENEKSVEASFSEPLKEEFPPGFFAGFRAQILVNIGSYKLGRGELEEAEKAVKEAMLINQSLKDRAVSAYRLFSLINLSKNRLGDALEYILFAADQAEKPVSAGKTVKLDEFEERIKAFYFAAVIHFLYGNLTKAEMFARRAEESAGTAEGRARISPPVPGLSPEWAAKARFLRGRLKFETGAYREARELFRSLEADSSGGPSLFSPDPSGRDRTIAAWIYRAQVYVSGFKNIEDLKPVFQSPDGEVFMIEAALLAEDFQKAARLADEFLQKEGTGGAAENAFFFTEQPGWQSGFSQCEAIVVPGSETLRRLARTYRALALCGAGIHERDYDVNVKEWEEFLRRDLLADGDPGDSFYFYAFYCILQKTDASRVDMGTAVSMAFKRLQRRAGRIEDNKTRQLYIQDNYWNSALCLAAKEYKLI